MIIDAYNDVADYQIQPAGSPYGKDILNVATLNAGFGNKSFKFDDQGIWLGANRFATAPFKVDMLGNLTSTSATITGYATDSEFSNALVKDSIIQILSGKIIVGDNKIIIDGVNKRILINDGTNDRILIGYQSGGF